MGLQLRTRPKNELITNCIVQARIPDGGAMQIRTQWHWNLLKQQFLDSMDSGLLLNEQKVAKYNTIIYDPGENIEQIN